MIDAVVFDIGNVLIGWDPEGFYDRAIGREARERLFAEADLGAMNARIDLGQPLADEVAQTAAAHPDWADEIRRWHDDWLQIASPAKPDSVALLRALRSKGIPCWALTNFGIETLAIADAAYPFLSEFDARFVSSELGVMKPDAGIYTAVEAQGVPPERLLYTDDRPENLAVAEARGWNTHLFDGARGWADRLVAEGLLTAAEAA